MREYVRLQTAVLLRRFAFQVTRTSKSVDAESIHDLRVAIRRFSRCLRVFSDFYPGRSWKKIRTQLGKLMDVAGAVRDRDIALELLAEAGIAKSAAIVPQLQAERRQAARDLIGELRRWKRRDFSQKWRGKLGL
jgi:CHAD domain-containing protein